MKKAVFILSLFVIVSIGLNIYLAKYSAEIKEEKKWTSEDYRNAYDEGYDDGMEEGMELGEFDAEIQYIPEIEFFNAFHSRMFSKVMGEAPTAKFGEWFNFYKYTMKVSTVNKIVDDETRSFVRQTIEETDGKTVLSTEDESPYNGIFGYDKDSDRYYKISSIVDYSNYLTFDTYIQENNCEYVDEETYSPIPDTLYLFYMTEDGKIFAQIIKGK